MTTTAPRRSPGVPSPAKFGTRLAMVRQEFGWNLAEAARECGLTESTWRTWEQQGRLPQDYEGVCRSIAEATDLPLVWILTGQGLIGGDGESPTQNRKVLLTALRQPAAACAS